MFKLTMMREHKYKIAKLFCLAGTVLNTFHGYDDFKTIYGTTDTKTIRNTKEEIFYLKIYNLHS